MGKKKRDIFEELRSSDQYFIERAKVDFALEMNKCMERIGLKNSELAERLGVSRPMVTKLLRGDANLTIETMVKVARKLDGHLHIGIVRNGCDARLFEVVRAAATNRPQRATRFGRDTLVSGSPWHAAAPTDSVDNDEAQPLAA